MKTSIIVLGALLAAQGAAAQSLESRIASAKGTVGFEFNTRANVCGNGQMIRVSDDTSPGWTTSSHQSGMTMGRVGAGDRLPCELGPGRVLLTNTDGRVTNVVVTVGGHVERPDTRLGAVSTSETARYLLSLAPRLSGRSADQAVMGAAIADSTSTWKQMLEIARDNGASEAARKATLFWVSQEATTAALVGVSNVAMDDSAELSVRRDALFFLGQRKGEGVPALIKVVRESKSGALRKEAMWHLSQSKDSRALDLFERLLAGKE